MEFNPRNSRQTKGLEEQITILNNTMKQIMMINHPREKEKLLTANKTFTLEMQELNDQTAGKRSKRVTKENEEDTQPAEERRVESMATKPAKRGRRERHPVRGRLHLKISWGRVLAPRKKCQ